MLVPEPLYANYLGFAHLLIDDFKAPWAKVAVTDGSWTPPAVQVETDGDQHRKENVQ